MECFIRKLDFMSLGSYLWRFILKNFWAFIELIPGSLDLKYVHSSIFSVCNKNASLLAKSGEILR